jgi:hypothetical protein
MPTSSDIKRALRKAGLEIYRTRGNVVHVAERVRENLIMDAGVRIDQTYRVTFYVRAEKRDFPGEDDAALFDRARQLAAPALERGFEEQRTFVTELEDPSDPERKLDHWYQVQLEKVAGSIELAIEEIRFACALQKQAKR